MGEATKAIDSINCAIQFGYHTKEQYKLFFRRGKQYLQIQVSFNAFPHLQKEFALAFNDFEEALRHEGLPHHSQKEITALRNQALLKIEKSSSAPSVTRTKTEKPRSSSRILTKVRIETSGHFGRHLVANHDVVRGKCNSFCIHPLNRRENH